MCTAHVYSRVRVKATIRVAHDEDNGEVDLSVGGGRWVEASGKLTHKLNCRGNIPYPGYRSTMMLMYDDADVRCTALQILRLVVFREFWAGMPEPSPEPSSPSPPSSFSASRPAAVTTSAVAARDDGGASSEAPTRRTEQERSQELASRVTAWFPRWG